MTTPKMVILNPKEYQSKFDEAMACSLSDQHERALRLLLELKEKRWRNFELFKLIAKEYIAIGKYDQAGGIIKEIRASDETQKRELFDLEQILKYQKEMINQQPFQYQELNLNQQYIEDEEIFKETQELQKQQQVLQQISAKNVSYYNAEDLKVLFPLGYYQTLKNILEIDFGQNFDKISTLPHQTQMTVCSIVIFFENYRLTLNLVERAQESSDTLLIKAFCYKQMKQYKLALDTLIRCYKLSQNRFVLALIKQLNYVLFINDDNNNYEISKNDPKKAYLQFNQINIIKEINFIALQQQIFKLAKQQNIIQCISQFKQLNAIKQRYLRARILQCLSIMNYVNFQPKYIVQLEYQISPRNPILQRICNFLMKYSPRYSAGYANQYQLFIDQRLMDDAFALERPLVQCEDCSLKYITLAKLYKDQKKFAQAHKALAEAKKLNEFNEEIYQIERDLFVTQKMYQQAYLSIRHLVQLEKENYRFICETIAPLIDKFEYYRVLELVQLVDRDQYKFDELKLLLRIISFNTKQENYQILCSIESLNLRSMIKLLGHYQLSKKKVKEALDSYQIEQEVEKSFFIQRQKIKQIINEIAQFKQYQINDLICQMGIYNYVPSQDKSKLIHQRYVNTIGFVLTSIVFSENIEENIKIINSKYDMEVPKIDNFNLTLRQIIERIYRQSYITSEKYQSYIGKGLLQLQNLFISTEIFLNQFYEFSDKHQQQMIEQFMDIDHEAVEIDEYIKKIYQIPFFADPISRYALISVIKIIGYFTDFELANGYQRTEEWLQIHMIKLNFEGFYKVLIKGKQNIQLIN